MPTVGDVKRIVSSVEVSSEEVFFAFSAAVLCDLCDLGFW